MTHLESLTSGGTPSSCFPSVSISRGADCDGGCTSAISRFSPPLLSSCLLSHSTRSSTICADGRSSSGSQHCRIIHCQTAGTLSAISGRRPRVPTCKHPAHTRDHNPQRRSLSQSLYMYVKANNFQQLDESCVASSASPILSSVYYLVYRSCMTKRPT